MALERPSDDSAHAAALRSFCEAVYRPTDQRRDEILAYDWGALPRIQAALRGLPAPVTPSAVAGAACTVIQAAVVELESCFPIRPDAITPLEVVRLHVLERQPWPSIEAQLRVQGRAHSRGTLIRRQHEFMPYLESWAAGGRRARRRRSWVAVGLLGGVLVVALSWLLAAHDPPRYMDVREYHPLRQQIYEVEDWPAIQEAMGFHVRQIPPVGFQPRGVVLLPPAGQRGPMAIAMARKDSPRPGRIAMWDPVSGELKWESEFTPTRAESITHSTLRAVAADDPFTANSPVYGELIADRIAVPYTNRFSACFVVQFDLKTGRVLSHYAHPGRLESGLVLDLNGDGQGEFVFVGQENTTERAVVVALAPTDQDGAASTVLYQSPPGREDARARTLLPPARELEQRLGVPRLQIRALQPEDWNAARGVLVLDVCALPDNPVYTAFLDSDLRLVDLLPGEAAEIVWRDAGLDPASSAALLDSAITAGGSDAELLASDQFSH